MNVYNVYEHSYITGVTDINTNRKNAILKKTLNITVIVECWNIINNLSKQVNICRK